VNWVDAGDYTVPLKKILYSYIDISLFFAAQGHAWRPAFLAANPAARFSDFLPWLKIKTTILY